MEPSGSETANVMVEYGVLISPTGLSHLGGIAKNAFFRPGRVRVSERSVSGPKIVLSESPSQVGTPCTSSRVYPSEGQS
jgi:hypothetical protein